MIAQGLQFSYAKIFADSVSDLGVRFDSKLSFMDYIVNTGNIVNKAYGTGYLRYHHGIL